jgi:hypothetical protein
MNLKEIIGDKYKVNYEPETQTVIFQGSLRQMGITEYQPIEELLESVIEDNPSNITLDLCELKLLNSAGIRMLSKFMITLRKKKTIGVIIQGKKDSTWQESSLNNLNRLMPTSKIEWQD